MVGGIRDLWARVMWIGPSTLDASFAIDHIQCFTDWIPVKVADRDIAHNGLGLEARCDYICPRAANRGRGSPVVDFPVEGSLKKEIRGGGADDSFFPTLLPYFG